MGKLNQGWGVRLFVVIIAFLAIDMTSPIARAQPPPVHESPPASVARQSAEARRSLAAAAKWLWAQQRPDGGWHSSTYKLLESGQALTPLVLDALLRVPPDVTSPTNEQYRKAVGFIRRHVSPRGVVGLDDPEVPEYPNYATSLAVVCLWKVGHSEDLAIIERMRNYLTAEQYCEARGFKPNHLAYGGWGFGGPLPLGGSPGHMDIAHTRHILEALRATTPLPSREGPGEGITTKRTTTFRRAEIFLRLMQRRVDETRPQPSDAGLSRPTTWRAPFDGGFYFSPVVLAANKGREATHDGQPYFRSYATATCEGVLALLAAGVPRDDDRVQKAATWLRDHPRLDYPEGVPLNQPEPWGESIAYYHFAARARTYAALHWPGKWRQDLSRLLAAKQDANGSYQNRVSHLMKEDDPLLATALAVSALSECLK